MKPIICITTQAIWDESLKVGQYTRSTISATLEEVGFIHATKPEQTMDIIPRFADETDVILLFIDPEKVTAPLRFEAAPSGRPGLFPHIYGPLNVDAVYKTVSVARDHDGAFVAPEALLLAQG